MSKLSKVWYNFFMIILSERQKSILKLFDHCNIVADIGTDHGYIPIYLLNASMCKMVIASDVHEKPLETAKRNAGLYLDKEKQGCLSFVRASGLSNLPQGGVDACFICGMGGDLMQNIINVDLQTAKNIDQLILQPQSNIEKFKVFLNEIGFSFIDEELSYDERKNIFYQSMKVRFVVDKPQKKYDSLEGISKILIEKEHPLIKKFANSKLLTTKKILLQLELSKNMEADEKMNSLCKKIEGLERLIKNL